MSLFFGKRKNTKGSKKPSLPQVENTKLRIISVTEERWGGNYNYYGEYAFGDGGRYTASVHTKQGHIRIHDNIGRVSAIVGTTGGGYNAYTGTLGRSMLDKKGYRLPDSTHASAASFPLLDDNFLLNLIEDSQKSRPEMWETARAKVRAERLDDIRRGFGFGAICWGFVFVLATLVTWAYQVAQWQ